MYMQVVIRREESLFAVEINGAVLPVTDYKLVSSASFDGTDKTELTITLDLSKCTAMELEITRR